MRRGSCRQAETQRLVDDVADAVFAGWQHFIIQLRQFSGDLEFQFVGRGILLALRSDEFLADPLLDFLIELCVFLRGEHAFGDQVILPIRQRIALVQVLEFFRRAIKFVIIRAGVAGESLHLHPEKDRPLARAEMRDRFLAGVVNRLHVGSVDLPPVVRLEDVDRERIDLPRRAADAVGVVLDDEEDGQLLLFRETDRLEEIALAGGGIADRRDDEVPFPVELDSPGDAAGRQELRAGRRRHAPDVARGVTVMRRHLPAVALAFALREIIERQLRRGDAAAEDERAVAIIAADVIARFDHQRNRGERFMSHAGNVEMPFALPVQILLAQIAVPALEQDREESKFVFLAQSHRYGVESC